MTAGFRTNRRAFSLIELVIVIIILGVISAIAIPRMMRAGEGADVVGLQSDLQVIRGAIEMYRYEHQAFPTLAAFSDQLTKETDASGALGTGFGPYVVSIPPLKTGTHKDDTGVAATAGAPIAEGGGATGWLYDAATGSIWANDSNHFNK